MILQLTTTLFFLLIWNSGLIAYQYSSINRIKKYHSFNTLIKRRNVNGIRISTSLNNFASFENTNDLLTYSNIQVFKLENYNETNYQSFPGSDNISIVVKDHSSKIFFQPNMLLHGYDPLISPEDSWKWLEEKIHFEQNLKAAISRETEVILILL